MRLLTPQEKAVFEAIVDQRLKGNIVGDVFRYDLREGQQFLHNNGASVELDIDHLQQWNIINQLAKDGFISIDLMGIYDTKDGEGRTSQVVKWVYGTDWARDYIQMSMGIDECFKKYNTSVFICLSLKDINRINKESKLTFKTRLGLDKDPLKLDVVCDNGKTYVLKAFNREKGRPHDVFVYVFNAGREVNNVELSKNFDGITDNVYVAKIYERNEIINTILSAHVKLHSDRMLVRKNAQQTPDQIEAIEKKAIRIIKRENR